MIPENLLVFFSVGSQQMHRIFDWHGNHPFSVDSLETLIAKSKYKNIQYFHRVLNNVGFQKIFIPPTWKVAINCKGGRGWGRCQKTKFFSKV